MHDPHDHGRRELPMHGQPGAGLGPGQAIDPVCGMVVDEASAGGKGLTAEHAGQRYYFCGRGCMLDFIEDPAHYLAPGYRPSM